MPSPDPEERSRIARQAALSRWSKEDPTATAIRAQRGLLAKFEREVDPDGTLTPAERTIRAERARRAHMIKLARVSRTRRAARRGEIPTRLAFDIAAATAREELAGGQWRTVPFSEWARPDDASDDVS